MNAENDGETGVLTRVLFVCLGNICRSPLAEGIFTGLIEELGVRERYEVDSAGTGAWHVGEPADARMSAVAREHGITLRGRARRVTREDLETFDWVIAMDRSNLRALLALAPEGASARLQLLRDFDPAPDDVDVPDPYYGGPQGFQVVYEIVDRSCKALLDHLSARAPET